MWRKLILLGTIIGMLTVGAMWLDAKGRGGSIGGGRGGAIGGARATSVGGAFGGNASSISRGAAAIGPAGGSINRGATAGSVNGPRGGSIDYGGAHIGGSGPLGGAAGIGAGGVKVTTPGGATAGRVGTAGGAIGPGGRGVGGAASVGGVVGPGGGVAGSAYRGGVAFGPGGAVAGGTRVGGVATANRAGTYRVSSATLRTQGVAVRSSFTHFNTFNANWYRGHPGAWFAAGWTAGRVWNIATWPFVASYCSFPATPVYYNYGSTVVYQDDRVYIDGTDVASAQGYAQQTAQIADVGRQANPSPKDDWQPLGVFALVQGEEKNSYKIFQLALNKEGVIRGNYYDALSDNTMPVYGSVNKARQLAAWSIGDRKDIVYEAGIANLTKDESPVLVHFGTDNTQQFTLIRVEQPKDGK